MYDMFLLLVEVVEEEVAIKRSTSTLNPVVIWQFYRNSPTSSRSCRWRWSYGLKFDISLRWNQRDNILLVLVELDVAVLEDDVVDDVAAKRRTSENCYSNAYTRILHVVDAREDNSCKNERWVSLWLTASGRGSRRCTCCMIDRSVEYSWIDFDLKHLHVVVDVVLDVVDDVEAIRCKNMNKSSQISSSENILLVLVELVVPVLDDVAVWMRQTPTSDLRIQMH